MKAVVYYRYGGPNVIEIGELPLPVIQERECLVKVCAASVNPSDWKVLEGKWKWATGNRFPRQIGVDFAGVIESIGKEVKEFKRGDSVVGSVLPLRKGAFAEYVAVPERALGRKPTNLRFEEAAGISVACSTAYVGLLHRHKELRGRRVLITGAGGGVGHFAVQLAKLYGAEVAAVCSGSKTDLCRSLGADHIIDYAKTDVLDQALRYDIILNGAASLTYGSAKKILAPQGEFLRLDPQGRLSVFLHSFMSQRQMGRRMWTYLVRPDSDRANRLTKLFEEEKLKVIIGNRYPMEKAADALQECKDGHARGKIIITI